MEHLILSLSFYEGSTHTDPPKPPGSHAHYGYEHKNNLLIVMICSAPKCMHTDSEKYIYISYIEYFLLLLI
jgi:hypothetical protein